MALALSAAPHESSAAVSAPIDSGRGACYRGRPGTDRAVTTRRGQEADRAARRGDSRDAVTLLVSHRFSTVRMADLIVVLDGARVVESGSHDELMAHGGHYAELYGIQAAAYR